MRIIEFDNNEDMGLTAASIVKNELIIKPDALLCAATGSSPLPLYQQLVIVAEKDSTLFQNFRLIPLDEWIGLPTPEGSCDSYLREHLVAPLQISKERYFSFSPNTADLNQECLRIQRLLKTGGPIDMCILGLGKNGHLGFNEPADVLQPHCHIADLTAQSQQHNMILNSSEKPTQGLTLGIQDILSSKRILMLVSGDGKEEAKEQFFSGQVSSQCPASFLWKHDNVDCLVVNNR